MIRKFVSIFCSLILVIAFFMPFLHPIIPVVFADEDSEILPADPGMEYSPFSAEKKQSALNGDWSILTIIGNTFSSFATSFTNFGACQTTGESCVEVNDMREIANQFKYLYGPGGGDPIGGPLLPFTLYQKFSWPDKPEDEQRYQYAGCYKVKKPSNVLQVVVAKAVNAFMAITKNPQDRINTITAAMRIGTALTGAGEPLSKFKMSMPNTNSNAYEMVAGKPQLKANYQSLISACEGESTGKSVPSSREPVIGSIGGGTLLNVQATSDEAIKYVSDRVGGIAWCLSGLSNFQQCLSYSVGYTFASYLIDFTPGHPTFGAFGTGPISESELPATVRPETKKLLSSIRPGGSLGAALPLLFWRSQPRYAASHGEVASDVKVNLTTDGQNTVKSGPLVYTMAKKFQTMWTRGYKCAVLPASLQSSYNLNNEDCKLPDDELPASSNWINNEPVYQPGQQQWCGQTPTLGSCGSQCMNPPSPVKPDAELNNPYMDNVITQAASQVQIPKCVLEAVAMIEGGMHWTESDNVARDECRPNMWGAAGPFQITIDRDTCGGTCASGAGYCPNTWGNSPGSPCDAPTAAVRAAEILRDKAKYVYNNSDCPYGNTSWSDGISSTNWKDQEDRIMKASCHYYGSDQNHGRLEGRTYQEFVIDHCQYTNP